MNPKDWYNDNQINPNVKNKNIKYFDPSQIDKKCSTCIHFLENSCRYNPPTTNGFPSVSENDICSKYSMKMLNG